MLQKSLAFLLLISHVNFSMFIAQVDEVDAYDAKGCRINDINSLSEYINDIILRRPGKPREDEDDDNARYFHIVKLANYSLHPQAVTLQGSRTSEAKNKQTLPHNTDQKLLSVFYDVVTPPPRSIA